jgi:hypothetical protein
VSQANPIAASAMLWGIVLIAAVIALGVVVWLVRRWALAAPGESEDDIWSLQHLREMKAQGRITAEEFEALKRKAVEASGAPTKNKASASSADDPALY